MSNNNNNTRTLLDIEFALVYMNQYQENCLRRYGSRVISFDGTHGLNKYKFLLHTMLVLDVDREGIPVGFLITNCNNRAVLNNYFIILCPKSRGTHHYNDYNE